MDSFCISAIIILIFIFVYYKFLGVYLGIYLILKSVFFLNIAYQKILSQDNKIIKMESFMIFLDLPVEE